jgi:hypothetical protein
MSIKTLEVVLGAAVLATVVVGIVAAFGWLGDLSDGLRYMLGG